MGLRACYGAVTAVLVAEVLETREEAFPSWSDRWHIMEKMDLQSTAELVLSAVRRGLVT